MKQIYSFITLLLPLISLGQSRVNRTPSKELSNSTQQMHIIAKNYGDSIVLRWAPGNASSWVLANKKGYILQRSEYRRDSNGKFTQIGMRHINIPVWSLNQWQEYFERADDSLALIAAELLYGSKQHFNLDSLSLDVIMKKYNEQKNNYLIALLIADFDPSVAKGLGLRFTDHHFVKEHIYRYSVSLLTDSQELEKDTKSIFISGKGFDNSIIAPLLHLVPGDRAIHLFWYSQVSNKYSGYLIYRSENGKDFMRLNKVPYVYGQSRKGALRSIEYVDSSLIDYHTYYYKVVGIDAFGDHSLPSDIVSGTPIDLTGPSAPVITGIKNIQQGTKIILHWSKPVMEPDIDGYIIGRSINIDGPFEPLHDALISVKDNEYTDEHPNVNNPNYYVVAAVDTAGNSGRSLVAYMNAEDHSPPAKPMGLMGSIDSSGRVAIHWNWNNEDDLAGYRIFFCNSMEDVFTPASADLLFDTLFSDSITLRTLTKSIYYKVIAYDRQNNYSEESDILVLHKPDLIAPVVGAVHGFYVNDSSVVIRWYPSMSSDVAHQIVYRRSGDSSEWKPIKQLPSNDSLLVDSHVVKGYHYSYCIEAMDSSGNTSGKSFPLDVYVYSDGKVPSIHGLTVIDEKGLANLSWNMPDAKVDYYILYVAINDNGLRLAGNIRGQVNQFTLKVIPGKYSFAIKAIYMDGRESGLSNIVQLVVE